MLILTDHLHRPNFLQIETTGDPYAINQILNLLAEPENKFTTLMNPSYLHNIHDQYRDGVSSIHILDEAVAPIIVGQQFGPFDHLKKTFDEKMARLFESGIITKETTKFAKRRRNRTRSTDDESYRDWIYFLSCTIGCCGRSIYS